MKMQITITATSTLKFKLTNYNKLSKHERIYYEFWWEIRFACLSSLQIIHWKRKNNIDSTGYFKFKKITNINYWVTIEFV